MEQLCLVRSHVSKLIIDAFSSYSSMQLQSMSKRRWPPCLHSCLSIIAPHSITLCHWTRSWLTVFRIHSAVIQSVCCSVHPHHMVALSLWYRVIPLALWIISVFVDCLKIRQYIQAFLKSNYVNVMKENPSTSEEEQISMGEGSNDIMLR